MDWQNEQAGTKSHMQADHPEMEQRTTLKSVNSRSLTPVP